MSKTLKTAAVTIVVMAALVAAAGLAIIYSGIIDIAATKPHYALTKWVLETAMDRSVERRAAKISPPSGYHATPEALHDYHKMCELCHGGPGKDPSEIGKGLRPKPPDLVKSVADMEAAEVFWVVKNGIRMTGMPAFGVTHPDAGLWEVVALVKSLPRMTAEEYRQAVEKQ